MKRMPIIGLAAAAVLLLVVGVAAATGGMGALSGDDEALSGSDADRAAQAAQAYVDAQNIDAEYSHVEAGDEDGVAYEVEFKTSGGEVEVLVGDDFEVLSHATEGGSDNGAEEDDD